MGDAPGLRKGRKKHRHRFYVPASRFDYSGGGEPLVHPDPDTSHHVRDVLRLSTGAAVFIFDNSGQEYEGEIIDSKPGRVVVKVVRAVSPPVESPLRITLAQALLKGNAFERVLTLAAELGSARIVPLFTSRTVVRLNRAAAADRVPRWERIVQEAAAQCGRVKVPSVEMPLEFKEFLEKKHEGTRIILWERGGSGQLRPILEEAEKNAPVVLLAGPEGGFEQAEVKLALDAGFAIWGLGPRTLRAETAGPTALALLQYQLGDMG